MLELAVEPAQLVVIAESLTPLPTAVVRLNEIISAGSPTVAEVVDVISFDPALAAAVMQGANSAMYTRQRAASTIQDAVLRLGLSGLVGVAMRMATASTMGVDLPVYNMRAGDLLDHSARAAAAAEVLRRHAPARVPAPATVAALLHDTGKLVLNQLVGDRFAALVDDLAAGSAREPWQVEQEVFGVDHAAVAAYLGRHWKLPMAVVDGMVNHHEPANGTAVAHAVHIANVLAEATLGEQIRDNKTLDDSFRALGISPADLNDLFEATVELLEATR